MAKGFKNIAKGIAAKEGIPLINADKILASQTRKASPAAKAKNPALKKVAMPGMPNKNAMRQAQQGKKRGK